MDKFRQIKKLGNLALNYKTKDFNKVHGSDKVIFNFLLDISFVSAWLVRLHDPIELC